jgi:hypothetical protein
MLRTLLTQITKIALHRRKGRCSAIFFASFVERINYQLLLVAVPIFCLAGGR